MRLVIVESPSKAKTIGKYLGKGYKVVGSGGHIRDLPEKTLGIDIKRDFNPRYVLKDKMKKNISELRKEVEKAEKIYLATDPDREGEAISWHLKETLNIDDDKARIVFNEISRKAIQEAIKNPRDINMNLVNAQQARRVLDRLVGYMLSPVISYKIRSGLSAGRVQSAALRMIVEREREINAFTPEEYWNLYGYFKKLNYLAVLKADLSDIDDEKIKLSDKAQIDKILKELNQISNWRVDSVKKSKQLSHPKAPFTTSTLQQEASQKFNISTSLIMSQAQKLYEGVDIQGEHIALVTYIRTDSVRVSADAVYEAVEYIKDVYGEEYLPKKANFYKNRNTSQDAHEAIRPISVAMTPKSLEGKLDKSLLRLYKLIYDRFIASQMNPAEYNVINVRIEGGRYGFKLQGKKLAFKGYLAAYNSNSNEDETESIPDLNEGEELTADKFDAEQKFTQPPSRYSESTLVKAMEENGIGRPSTYATVIQTLFKRYYTEKDNKLIKPTETGMLVCDVMMKFFPDIIDLKFTAKMEDDLDNIDENRPWQEIIRKFYPEFDMKIKEAMRDRTKYKTPVIESDKTCSKCGKVMLIRTGRYGKFYACSGYPECRNILPYEEPSGVCPKCGGDIIKRRTKKGRIFYGCGNYPDCDFVSWDLPAPVLCPECGSPMKAGKEYYTCCDKKCAHKIKAVNEAKG